MIQTLERQDVEIEISPEPIYQLALGFAATKTLLVAQRLGFFASLAVSPKTAAQISEEHSLPLRTTAMLLDTCVSLKLCEKAGETYSNSAVSQRYLVPGVRGYLGRFLDHFNNLMYPTWSHLEEAVKTGHAQILKVVGENNDNFFQAIDRQLEHLKTFMETMEEHSLLEGEALARTYDFSGHHQMVDVGGGTGAMSVAILERYLELKSIVFDRAPVCEIADRSIAQHGLSARIQTKAGDFFKDPIPASGDVILLSAILHNWSPSNAKDILRQCHKALAPGKTLLISEQVLNAEKTEPSLATLCSLNMLVMLEGAQEYSSAEFEAMLEETGFHLEEIRSTGGFRQLLIARRR